MKILITISLIKDLCNNGLNQNIIFLGELLESIGLEVFYVVDHGPRCIAVIRKVSFSFCKLVNQPRINGSKK